MPEPVRIRFVNFPGMDYSTAAVAKIPRVRPPAFGEQTLLDAAISALSATGSNVGRLLASTRAVASGGAPMSITGMIPGAIIPASSDWTVAEGLTGGAGVGYAYSLGGGLYFWRKSPGFELGLFGSISVGFVTNMGASAGVQLAYLFGPAPSVLAGDSITVSVSVDIGGASVAGSLILSAPPSGIVPPPGMTLAAWLPTLRYTPTIIGVGVAMTMGISVFPVDISVMPGRTWTTAMVTR